MNFRYLGTSQKIFRIAITAIAAFFFVINVMTLLAYVNTKDISILWGGDNLGKAINLTWLLAILAYPTMIWLSFSLKKLWLVSVLTSASVINYTLLYISWVSQEVDMQFFLPFVAFGYQAPNFLEAMNNILYGLEPLAILTIAILGIVASIGKLGSRNSDSVVQGYPIVALGTPGVPSNSNFCRSCGQPMLQNATFCTNCGTRRVS